MKLFPFFRKKTSGSVAKDRLKILLISDRVACSPELMEQLKNEIVDVISRYMKIDAESTQIQITQAKSKEPSGKHPVLYANIPILDIRS